MEKVDHKNHRSPILRPCLVESLVKGKGSKWMKRVMWGRRRLQNADTKKGCARLVEGCPCPNDLDVVDHKNTNTQGYKRGAKSM